MMEFSSLGNDETEPTETDGMQTGIQGDLMALDKEMDVARRPRSKSGNVRRRVPKTLALSRTRKKKALDEEFYDSLRQEENLIAEKKRRRRSSAVDRLDVGEAARRRSSSSRTKSRLFRMKNFASAKLAQIHGDAISALARGLPDLSIQLLKKLARDAPTAPQVYSSLGMVYESMIKVNVDHNIDNRNGDAASEHVSLNEKLDIAKRAYGSFHVAALLCKKDYTLWVKAADMGILISEIHTDSMIVSCDDSMALEHHRGEKLRWLNQSKSDYQSADVLNPFALDVTAKLAMVQIQLCELPEALDLLNASKNQPGDSGKASLFDSSFQIWLLYSDLMLKIGYECHQWMIGRRKGKSAMKKWLKKHGDSFNWQEHRLHALTKALEVAAGSESTENLLHALRMRQGDSISNAELRDTADSENDYTIDDHPEEKQAQEQLDRHQMELDIFEQAMNSVDLSEPSSLAAREAARQQLVARQKQEKKIGSSSRAYSTGLRGKAITYNSSKVPLCASASEVTSIASELIRHMLSMGIGQLGRWVIEAVQLYLHERAEKRKLSEKGRHQQSRELVPVLTSFLNHAASAVSEDAGEIFESDSDSFDHSSPLGSVTPELRFLYGICVCFEDNKAYLGLQCLRAVSSLPIEDQKWLTEPSVDTNPVVDPSWLAWHEEATAPLTRVCALSLLVKCLEWSSFRVPLHRLADIFSPELAYVSATGLFKATANLRSSNEIQLKRRDKVLQLLTSSLKCHVQYFLKLPRGSLSKDELLQATEHMLNPFQMHWTVLPDGSISQFCVDMLQIAAEICAVACESTIREVDCLESLCDHFHEVVCLASGSPWQPRRTQDFGTTSMTLGGPPFSGDKMTQFQKQCALRAYNCAVAVNCTNFSGWCKLPFSRAHVSQSKFCGLDFSSVHTRGTVGPGVVQDLVRIWEALAKYMPKSSLNVSELLRRHVHASGCDRVVTPSGEHCGSFGEHHFIKLLTSFARLTLLHADCVADVSPSNNILSALYFALPLSQFVLQEELWTSSIGRTGVSSKKKTTMVAAKRTASVKEPKTAVKEPKTGVGFFMPSGQDGMSLFMTGGNPGVLKRHTSLTWSVESTKALRSSFFTQGRKQTSKRCNLKDKLGTHHLLRTFGSEHNHIENNLISIPSAYSQGSWKLSPHHLVVTDSHKQLMDRVWTLVLSTRHNFSRDIVDLRCLHISASLLNLVSDDRCENPILCIKQAVSFASLGKKAGSSSCFFKLPIPGKSECSQAQALAILGRAECFLVLSFYEEAAFLCTFVLKVYSENRLSAKSDPWKLVGLLVYNLSVSLRYVLLKMKKEHSLPNCGYSYSWDRHFEEQLLQARLDALDYSASFESDHNVQHLRKQCS